MITYEYRCSTCQHQFEHRASIKDAPLKHCHCCQQYTLERIIFGGSDAIVRQEATTLGQQAARNSKKMGKTKVQELTAQIPEDPFKKSERRQKIEKVLKRDKAGIEKYIMTGK